MSLNRVRKKPRRGCVAVRNGVRAPFRLTLEVGLVLRFELGDRSRWRDPGLSRGRRRRSGRIKPHLYARQGRERAFDARTYLVPRQSAEATAERRDRNRSNAKLANDANQIAEPRLDVGKARLRAPAALGRKIQDVFRIGERAALEYLYATRRDLAGSASGPVRGHDVREGARELQRNALAHHALGIHRIDERLGPGFEQISVAKRDHEVYARRYSLISKPDRNSGGSAPGALAPTPAIVVAPVLPGSSHVFIRVASVPRPSHECASLP